MIARYATSIGIGAAVTFGLLFIMQLLIATGRGALTEASAFRVTDFVRVERNEIIETKQEKPEKPMISLRVGTSHAAGGRPRGWPR